MVAHLLHVLEVSFVWVLCDSKLAEFYLCQLKLHEHRCSHVAALYCLSTNILKIIQSQSDGSICLIKIICLLILAMFMTVCFVLIIDSAC